MAIGARAQVLRWMIVRETLTLVMIGVFAGAMAAAGRLVRTQLYGVSPGDPVATVAAIVVLLTIAAVAAYVPARHATRIDPVITLRPE